MKSGGGGGVFGVVVGAIVPYVWKVQNNIFYLPWYHRLTTYQWIATVNAVNISHHVGLETLWFGSYSGCKACLNRGF